MILHFIWHTVTLNTKLDLKKHRGHLALCNIKLFKQKEENRKVSLRGRVDELRQLCNGAGLILAELAYGQRRLLLSTEVDKHS